MGGGLVFLVLLVIVSTPWKPGFEIPMPRILRYVADRWHPGDVIWVQQTLRPQADFYADRAGIPVARLQGPPLLGAELDRMRSEEELSLAALPRRGRVWLLTGYPKPFWPEEPAKTARDVLTPGRRAAERVQFGEIELERVDFAPQD